MFLQDHTSPYNIHNEFYAVGGVIGGDMVPNIWEILMNHPFWEKATDISFHFNKWKLLAFKMKLSCYIQFVPSNFYIATFLDIVLYYLGYI